MIAKVSFAINGSTYEFTIDKGDDLSILNQVITFGNPPRNCKQVRNGFYRLETNKDKDSNIYVNMVCYGEGKVYKSKLGSYKDKSGFFWHNWKIDDFAIKRTATENQEALLVTEKIVEEPAVVTASVEEEIEDLPF